MSAQPYQEALERKLFLCSRRALTQSHKTERNEFSFSSRDWEKEKALLKEKKLAQKLSEASRQTVVHFKDIKYDHQSAVIFSVGQLDQTSTRNSRTFAHLL